jgi:PAS domain S-box-containing protein
MTVRHVKYAMLAVIFLVSVTSCQPPEARQNGKQNNEKLSFSSFRDVQGITKDEISAIEALQKKKNSLIYGIVASTEAFIGENGEIRGYTPLFCDWLSRLLEMPVELKFYEPDDLLKGLESGDVDFTGELARTPEYQSAYFMTGPITRRSVKIYRIDGGEPIEDIVYSRPPRFAFLERSTLSAYVAANAVYNFETILTENHSTAYRLLKSGEVDAFLDVDTVEIAFDAYSNVVSEDFFPFIFLSYCLSTQRTELQPIISAVEKALDSRTIGYLTKLYFEGHQQYLKYKLYTMLTEGERLYIQDVPIVPVAAEFSNYPLSFFDAHKTKWEGIYFDILAEISKLCSLTFIPVNDAKTTTPVLINMLENGEVLIAPELFHIEKYEGRFLWSNIPVLEDNYALITKSDFRNIRIDEVFFLKAGVRKDSVYSELFRKMFPGHWNLSEYDTMEELWSALERGEIEMLFASRRRLIIYTNYYEDTSYKINLAFDHSLQTSFGFNKDAYILKSIIDKALRIINVNNITNQWMHKSYDYERKLVEAQRPLLGGLILFFIVLITVTILLMRSQGTGKKLEELVRMRTAELALQTSKLYAIFDSIPDAVICKDLELRYTQCNKVMEEFTGVKEKDILGKDSAAVLGLPPDITEQITEVDKITITEGIKIVNEEIIPHLDGRTVIFETIRAPLVLDGATIGLVAISRDITRRKAMEEETRAASQAKSAFLANMSHELRTPLNVVIGLTDSILEDDKLDKDIVDNLAKISNVGSTLLSIVNDILDISKIESGRLELVPVEYQMSSLLSDVITLVITRIGEKPISFVLDIGDDLPNSLYGDDIRVKQIFNNLLSNAIKYTHKGSVKLSVTCQRNDKNISMKITVSDTGIGIREKDIEKLFSEYNQVDTRANRSIEGTGLGLAITKRLSEMMGGGISVESVYGKGTTFHVSIQQGSVSDTSIGPLVAENLRNFSYKDDKRLVGKKLVRKDLSFARVLVVDDMQTNLDVAAGLLRKYKMQVDCLTNGADAVERIRSGNPVYNIVFMDHMMPGMDGIETADAIRAIGTEYATEVPIIALTANAIQGTDNLFFEHGFQAYITKPIDLIMLDSAIKKWIRNGSKDNEETSDK